VNANWSYPRAMIDGRSVLIAFDLSFLSPMSTTFAQRVSSRFFCLVFSLFSGLRPLICFTVLSLAITATMIGFAKRFERAFAWRNRFSCPAWRWSKVPNNIIV